MKEVIIIGGGVAGLFAALHLEPRFKVTVIEKEAFPPKKVCAGMLVTPAYDEIAPFNPPDSIFYEDKKVPCEFTDIDSGLSLPITQSFYNVNRQKLNGWLYSLAGSNVVIMDRCRPVKLESRDEKYILEVKDPGGRITTLEGDYIIGAEGIYSFLRQRLFEGYSPPRIFTAQYDVMTPFPEKKGIFIFDSTMAKGYYTWVFPKDFGFVAGTIIEGKNYKNLPARLKELYGVESGKWTAKGHPITMLTSKEEIRLGKGKAFLVGEAAGLVRPSSGEGLTQALTSGRLAAEAINQGGDSPLETYKASCLPMIQMLARDIGFCSILFDVEKRHQFYLKHQVPIEE